MRQGGMTNGTKKDSNEARKDKHVKAKSNTIRKGNETSRKTQRRQKSNNDTGHKASFVVLLSALPVLKKRFNRHESGSKNDITIRL